MADLLVSCRRRVRFMKLINLWAASLVFRQSFYININSLNTLKGTDCTRMHILP